MFHLNGIQQQATFLLMLGYSRQATIRHLHVAFPGQDAEAAWNHARAQAHESQRQLSDAVRRDDRRAVEAEHDLDQSIHGA